MSSDQFDDAWASRKLDMPRRQRELSRYMADYLPEFTGGTGLIVDIGCGPCDLMATWRDMGYDVLGVDAPSGEGGMGDPYLAACAQKCDEFGIKVVRQRAIGWAASEPLPERSVSLFHLRGSLEQVFSEYMGGDPHDAHHVASMQWWMEEPRTVDALFLFLVNLHRMLVDGGTLLIHANGAANQDWYIRNVVALAEKSGLQAVETNGPELLHKWIKPEPGA